MIARLRVKFVLLNMAFVTLLLAAVFIVVLRTTQTGLEADALRDMRQAALEPAGPGLPGRRPGERHLPCFTLRMGARGEVIAAGDGWYDLTDEVWLRELLAAAAQQGGEQGILTEYGLRFCWTGAPGRPAVTFADMSGEARTMGALLRTCLAAGGVAFLGFLAASVLLSSWAAAPAARAWEQQRQFVADASHELKTPLTVILTNAELLRAGPDDQAARDRFTASILTTARQMRSLTESLLELARTEDGRTVGTMERLDFSHLVREALLPFEPVFFEAGLTLDSKIEEGLFVKGTAGQLLQATDILLDNAQKYTAPGGTVTVTLERKGRGCLLTVLTPGRSLSPQERRDVFRRFYRADPVRSREGSYGLGLSIAQGIVSQHGGRIWAESEADGNAFRIRLPAL